MWQSQIKKISKWVPLRGVGGGGAIQVCTLSAQKVDLKTQKWQNTNNKKNSTKKGGGGQPLPLPCFDPPLHDQFKEEEHTVTIFER